MIAVSQKGEMILSGGATVTRRDQILSLGLITFALLISGCQTGPAKQAGLDNTGFMSLWETYTHCSASADLSEAYRDVRTLTQATHLRYGHDGFVLPLPSKLQQLVSNPTSRFAVDVKAMASACSLHAGQIALEQGQIDLARELFAAVLSLHRQEESSYYLVQAKALLTELNRGIHVSLTTP